MSTLPEDAAERYRYPMAEGLLYYFPAALAAVAKVSRLGNEQHNPGQPMHWARGKSTEHADKILRHLVDAGLKDSSGVRHSARLAWRALALLQEELEREEGAGLPRNARLPEPAVVHTLVEALEELGTDVLPLDNGTAVVMRAGCLAECDEEAEKLVRAYAENGEFCILIRTKEGNAGKPKLIFPQCDATKASAWLHAAGDLLFDGRFPVA